MRGVIVAAVCVIVPMAFGQEVRPPNWEYQDLYGRASKSALVVQGKTVERKPVWKRGVPRVVEKSPGVYETANLSDVVGGAVLTVDVSAVLCAKEDFVAGKPQRQPLPARVQVFVREARLCFHCTDEQIFKDREYLLFLSPDPRQKDLHEWYELEPDVTYYRVDGGNRGAHEMSERTARLASTVKALCGAARPAGDVGARD